jgi:hypothetical protein
MTDNEADELRSSIGQAQISGQTNYSTTTRKPWATPKVIISVDARSVEAKHLTHNPDTHPPSSSTAVYS